MELDVSSLMILATTLCGIITVLFYHLRRLPLYRAAARCSGPLALPIIGNAHYFAGNPDDLLNKMITLVKTYPAPIRFWFGNRLVFAVWKAEHIKTILNSVKAIEKADVYRFARPWMGTGMFTAPASKWRVHRRLISPAFSPKILETFVETFSNQSKILVRQLADKVDGQEFDIFNYVSLCTLDIICEAAMGIELKAQTEQNSRYVDSSRSALEVMVQRMSRVWLQSDLIFNCTRLAKAERESLTYLHGFTDDVIKQRREEQSKTNVQPKPKIDDDDDQPRKKAFLDLLMELNDDGTKFSDENLREEVDTMMIAGSDTSANVHTFVMLMLASHPEIQKKVHEELCEIYGQDDNGRDVVYEDLQHMEYLERVIKETLRIFPVAPIIMRNVTEDLDIGECTFPKGSTIILGMIETHRNEEYWPDPLKFDPDRFLPSEIEKRHPYTFIPFSAGLRSCIGGKYAMLSLKTLLATVLRSYTFKKDIITPIKDIGVKAHLILRPMEKIKIRIERRKPKVTKNI